MGGSMSMFNPESIGTAIGGMRTAQREAKANANKAKLEAQKAQEDAQAAAIMNEQAAEKKRLKNAGKVGRASTVLSNDYSSAKNVLGA